MWFLWRGSPLHLRYTLSSIIVRFAACWLFFRRLAVAVSSRFIFKGGVCLIMPCLPLWLLGVTVCACFRGLRRSTFLHSANYSGSSVAPIGKIWPNGVISSLAEAPPTPFSIPLPLTRWPLWPFPQVCWCEQSIICLPRDWSWTPSPITYCTPACSSTLPNFHASSGSLCPA